MNSLLAAMSGDSKPLVGAESNDDIAGLLDMQVSESSKVLVLSDWRMASLQYMAGVCACLTPSFCYRSS